MWQEIIVGSCVIAALVFIMLRFGKKTAGCAGCNGCSKTNSCSAANNR